MLFRYSLFSFFLFVSMDTFSQSVQREVISTSGGFGSNSGAMLQSTIGELMPDTYFSGTIILSQGFEQPDPFIPTAISTRINTISGQAYPNPVINELTISLPFAADITVEISDLLGAKYYFDNSQLVETYEGFKFNMEKLSSGIYFIRVRSKSAHYEKVFKIVKASS